MDRCGPLADRGGKNLPAGKRVCVMAGSLCPGRRSWSKRTSSGSSAPASPLLSEMNSSDRSTLSRNETGGWGLGAIPRRSKTPSPTRARLRRFHKGGVGSPSAPSALENLTPTVRVFVSGFQKSCAPLSVVRSARSRRSFLHPQPLAGR